MLDSTQQYVLGSKLELSYSDMGLILARERRISPAQDNKESWICRPDF